MMELDGGSLTRRQFIVRAAQSGTLVVFGGVVSSLLSSCSGKGNSPADVQTLPTIKATATNNQLTISTASGSPISAVGSAALIQYSGGYLLAAHTASNTFVVVSAICTHQGCIVNGFSGGFYICPCHGSEFDTNGSVVKGPATAALARFSTQVSNDQLVISV